MLILLAWRSTVLFCVFFVLFCFILQPSDHIFKRYHLIGSYSFFCFMQVGVRWVGFFSAVFNLSSQVLWTQVISYKLALATRVSKRILGLDSDLSISGLQMMFWRVLSKFQSHFCPLSRNLAGIGQRWWLAKYCCLLSCNITEYLRI